MKRVANPLDFGLAAITDDSNHVKSAIGTSATDMPSQVDFGGSPQSHLLGAIDGFGGVAETHVTTKTYLDENQCRRIAHDEVDLAKPRGKIPLDQGKPLAFQVTAGILFCPRAINQVTSDH